jgi:hypothetical protein
LDEDSTTLDLDGTTIGTVTTATTATNVTTVNGLANNVITTASINDGALTKADHHADFWQALRDTVWDADSTTYANDAGSMAKAASATGAAAGGISEADMWTMLDTVRNANFPALDSIMRDVLGDTLATFNDSTELDGMFRDAIGDTFNNVSGAVTVNLDNATGTLSDAQVDAITVITDLDASTGTLSDAQVDNITVTAGTVSDKAGYALSAAGNQSVADSVWMVDSSATYVTGLNMANVASNVGTGTGATAQEVWEYATRTLTSGGGTTSLYPFLERTTTVDGVGAAGLTYEIFTIDTAALGTRYPSQLLNKAITVRSGSNTYDKGIGVGVIERVGLNNTTGVCSLQVADSLPFPVAVGDSVWIWSAGPSYNFATLGEALSAQADTIFNRDTTNYTDVGSFGEAIVSGGTGTGSDTVAILALLNNHNVTEAADTILIFGEQATSVGLLRRSEVFTTADSFLVKGGIVDTVLTGVTTTGQAFGDTITQIFSMTTEVYDSVRSQVWATSGTVTLDSAALADIIAGVAAGINSLGTGIYALTVQARDTVNSANVQGVLVVGRSGATTVSGTTDDNGLIVFNVDSASWTIDAYGSPYTWVPSTLIVASDTTDTITGGGVLVATPDSPDEAVVYGTLIGGNGSVASGWDIRFTLEDVKANLADTSTGQIVVLKTVETSTNGSGAFSTGLLKTENLLYKSGTSYKHPVWRMVASPSDVKNDPRIDFTFSIPSDSTFIDVGQLIKAGAQ